MTVLEACGYQCTRSAASLGEWDIVAISSHDVVLCQARRETGPEPWKWRSYESSRHLRTVAKSYTAGATANGCRT